MAVNVDELPLWLKTDIVEFCKENNRELPTTQEETLEVFLERNGIGIIRYTSRIRHAVFEIMASSDEYMTTTDRDKADWLRKVAEIPDEVTL